VPTKFVRSPALEQSGQFLFYVGLVPNRKQVYRFAGYEMRFKVGYEHVMFSPSMVKMPVLPLLNTTFIGAALMALGRSKPFRVTNACTKQP
jgi:hypothetical protein